MNCPKYFIFHSSDPSYAHHEARKENVDKYVNDLDCAVIEPAYWKNDWEVVKNFYSFFQIPFKFPFTMGWPKKAYKDSTKGKYSQWVTIMLFAKYSYDISRSSNLALVEDDCAFLYDFDKRYSNWGLKSPKPSRTAMFGCLHLYNDISAEFFIRKIFLHGVRRPYDHWLHGNDGFKDLAEYCQVTYKNDSSLAIALPDAQGDINGSNSEVAVDLPFPPAENPTQFNRKKYPSWFNFFGPEAIKDESNPEAVSHKIKADEMASKFLDYPLFNLEEPYDSSNFDYPSILKSIPKK